MKKSSRILSCLMALLLMLPCFTVFASASDSGGNDGTDKTKRIVSVVYDNSSSMKNRVDKESGDDTSRSAYAKYSLRMLMSLLGENDELILTPLNGKASDMFVGVVDDSDSIVVDLAAKDREAVIDSVFDKNNDNFLVRAPKNLTPGDSPLAVALNILENGIERNGKKYGGGLEKRQQGVVKYEQNDTEYWLVILSDGNYEGYQGTADILVKNKTEDYQGLKTIFIGISTEAPDLEDTKNLNQTFTGKKAISSDNIIKVMQEVANQLTGRCPADSGWYSVSGNKVTLDLKDCKYAVKSVSVIVQNSGVTSASTKYNGQKAEILQPCVISTGEDNFTDFKDYVNMKPGYTAVIETGSYMYGGKLEIEFSDAVKDIAVMLEPALRVETYLERLGDDGSWIRSDMQDIYDNLDAGDQIRAGFEVFEQASGNKIELSDIFGDVEATVTYATADYDVGAPIRVKAGKEDVTIKVSVLNGDYTVYSSATCIVRASKDEFMIDSKVTDNSEPGKMDVDVEYSVIMKTPLSADELKKCKKIEAVLYHSNSPDKATDLKTEITSDGKVKVNTEVTSGEYGDYVIKFTVVSEDGIAKSEYVKAGFSPKALGLSVKGADTISVSQHGIKKNTKSFTFALSSMDFDSSIIKYRLEVDGKDLTEYAVVDGKTITYVPAADHFGGSVSIGAKSVDLIVECPSFPTINEKATVTLDITDIAYELNPLDRGNKKIDRFDVKGSNAALYFEVTRDGERLPLAELETSVKAGEFKVKDPSGVFSWCFWLPTGIEVNAVEDGVVEYKVVRDRISILGVNFMSMFMSGGDKNITAEYRKADATATLTVGDSPAFAYIWRILFFILLVYLLLWAAGFFFGLSKSHPRGVFVKIVPRSDITKAVKIDVEPVNMNFREKWLWHLKRFFKPFLWGDQEPRGYELFLLKYSKTNKAHVLYLEDLKTGWTCFKMMKTAHKSVGVLMGYIDSFKTGGGTMPTIKTGDFKAGFKVSAPKIPIEVGSELVAIETPYGFFDKNGNLKYVVFYKKF